MKLKLFIATCLLISVSLHAQDAAQFVKEGIALHDQGAYAQAIEKYNEALKLNPTYWNAYYEIAYSYNALKEYEKAIASADLAIKYCEEKDRLYPYMIKGSALDDMGNTPESVKFYKQALKEFPDNYLLLYNYALSCTRLGDIPEAEKSLVKGLQNNLSHASSHLLLANIKLDQNQKVFSAMGLYFFLMLESKSGRSNAEVLKLKKLMYGSSDSKEGNKNIVISMPDGKADTKTGAAELMFSLLGFASDEIDRTVTGSEGRTEQQKFVDDTKKLFSTLKELSQNSKESKKKKSKAAGENFWWGNYVPFYAALNDAGHTEAFCYHIMQSNESEEISVWIEQNKEKVEFFYLWLEGK
jgi:tetratricopeptide (TPR) repeat protein